MCSIVLWIGADGVFIGANRDETVDRAWDAPGMRPARRIMLNKSLIHALGCRAKARQPRTIRL